MTDALTVNGQSNHTEAMENTFQDPELQHLIFNSLQSEAAYSIGLCLDEEEEGVAFYVMTEDGEFNASDSSELKGFLRALTMMHQAQQKKEREKPAPRLEPEGQIDPEELDRRMERDRPLKAEPRLQYGNPIHEALRITIEGYGQYKEIHCSSLVKELETFTRIEKERLKERAKEKDREGNHERAQKLRKQAISLTRNHWIAQFETHRIGHTEMRPGEPHDYSVLILNEQHDLVEEYRKKTGKYPRVT